MYAIIDLETGKTVAIVSSKREADFLIHRSTGYEAVQV